MITKLRASSARDICNAEKRLSQGIFESDVVGDLDELLCIGHRMGGVGPGKCSGDSITFTEFGDSVTNCSDCPARFMS